MGVFQQPRLLTTIEYARLKQEVGHVYHKAVDVFAVSPAVVLSALVFRVVSRPKSSKKTCCTQFLPGYEG